MLTRLGTSVGITNTRLNTAKRGVAIEIGARLAGVAEVPVCIVAADPADRDVERHLPDLIAAWGEPKRMEVNRGPHHLEVADFTNTTANVCVVSVSDRESIELVLPSLQERFRFLVIDAPSRTGPGVGIADVLLDWLDALVVATALTAGELAETRHYVEHLNSWPSARHVDVRVLATSASDDSGLAHSQLDSRLAALPMIGHVPRTGLRVSNLVATGSDARSGPLAPLIRWIVDSLPAQTAARTSAGARDP